ncbi:MAG: glycosyltransferase family 9 protein [Bacteroidales bacterium]
MREKKCAYPCAYPRILLIQTASLGDVILSTALVEELHAIFPKARLDFLTKTSNAELLKDHPYLNTLWLWDKKKKKYKHLFCLLKEIRKVHYDVVFNVQRFFSTGFLTTFSNADCKIGFDKNPWSFAWKERVVHRLDKQEIERNAALIAALLQDRGRRWAVPIKENIKYLPKLYPSSNHFQKVKNYKGMPYFCISPASLWSTKTWPEHKWIALSLSLLERYTDARLYFLGSSQDEKSCWNIINKITKENPTAVSRMENLAGKIDLLSSAALMQGSVMNYTNDSAPAHLAGAVYAPLTLIFCSTVPSFGFVPIGDKVRVVESKYKLDCRPCGLHGQNKCKKGNFLCAESITIEEVLGDLPLSLQ